MSEIKGGFFIYRAKPDGSSRVSSITKVENSENQGFNQAGEIVGMVVIKKYGEREFFAYVPIDQNDPNPGNLMTNFVDTTVPNPHDIDPTNVFDMIVFEAFIKKIIES